MNRACLPSRGLARLLRCLFPGFVIALTSLAPGEDWPRFLGLRGDNASTETGLLARIPSNGPPVLWEQAVGTGYSAPSVRAGQVVLHHRVGREEIVQSYAAATGKPGWRHAYPSAFVDPYGYNNGPRCTPILTSNRCYTFGAEGRLVCLDIADGRLVWQRETQKDFEVPEAFFGVGSTPLLDGDQLFVMVGGQPNAGVVAFDAATGRQLWANVGRTNWQGVITKGWRAEVPYQWTGVEKSASYASPMMATIHGERHLLCFMRQGLVSLNPTNGAVRFSYWFQSLVSDSVNAMTPVVRDDLIVISAAYFRIGAVALRVAPDGRSVTEAWRAPARIPVTGPMLRETPPQPLEMHWTTPVWHDGHLYAFSGRNEPDAQFNCVEFATGKLKWSREESWAGHPPPGSRAQPPVYGRGSAIVADGRLYVLGEGGLLGAFALDSRQPVELGRWQVPGLSYPCWAGPVLSEKRLFLRSEDRLVCLNLAR